MIEKILERLEEERESSYADFEEYLTKFEIANEFSSDDDWFFFGLKRAKRIVQEVAKEYESCEVMRSNCEVADGGWIPCSERLPELNTRVMCFTVDETYVIAEYGGSDSHYLDSKDVWFSDNGWYRKDDIIAWQPLPTPY